LFEQVKQFYFDIFTDLLCILTFFYFIIFLGKLDSMASSGGSPKSIGISPLGMFFLTSTYIDLDSKIIFNSTAVSAPANMVTADSGRRGSTQSDTSALLSSLTRDLSHSPSNSSLQMRSESQSSLPGQVVVSKN
jgi:hypothetical protein